MGNIQDTNNNRFEVDHEPGYDWAVITFRETKDPLNDKWVCQRFYKTQEAAYAAVETPDFKECKLQGTILVANVLTRF